MLAKATVTYSTSEMEDNEISEELQSHLTDQFQRLALGSAVCAVSIMLDIGLIQLNGEAVGIGPNAATMNPDDLFGGGL
jgi:hypothetical protein